MLTKFIDNINQFLDHDMDFNVSKAFLLCFGFVYTMISKILYPVLHSHYINVMVSLIMLTTVVGCLNAKKNKEAFSWRKILKVVKKFALFGSAVYICEAVAQAPLHTLAEMLSNTIYTVLICFEASSAMKVCGAYFDSRTFKTLGDRAQELGESLMSKLGQEPEPTPAPESRLRAGSRESMS